MMYNLESGDADLQKAVINQTVNKIIIDGESVEVILQLNAENISPATEKELPRLNVNTSR